MKCRKIDVPLYSKICHDRKVVLKEKKFLAEGPNVTQTEPVLYHCREVIF